MARRNTPALRTLRKLNPGEALNVPPSESLAALCQIAEARCPPAEWGEVVTVRQVAEAIHKHRVTVDQQLRKLREAGKVRGGEYRLRGSHQAALVYCGADVVAAARRGDI